MKKFLVILSLLGMIVACNKAEDIHVCSYLSFRVAPHFPEPIYKIEGNIVSEKIFQLGKRLFYDPLLSRNNSISCGSCHISQHGFTHHGHDVSHGVDDRLGTRNSMPLMNLAWSSTFFWDGGVHDLDLTAAAPIENHVEMDESLSNVIKKLQDDESYRVLFKDAFGSNEINSAQFFKAMGTFMAMLISDNAKYDKVMNGKAKFTADEQRGYSVFHHKCASCHREPLFTDYTFRNNGLPINPANDWGRYTITGQDNDRLKFKVPSLRNLKYTAPYMHDGRLYTLQAVLNHYNREVQYTQTLDPILKLNIGIQLTKAQQSDLLAFLNTLNDESFIYNTKFGE